MSRLVTIGEAARELGVSTKTLRRYEERGLLKPIRTMGGQRRYYLSVLRDVLTSAEEHDPAPTPSPSRTSDASHPTTSTPMPREASVWDEVEEEKASFEALKIRAQREVFMRTQDEDAERILRERQAMAEAARRAADARAAEEQAALAEKRAMKDHVARLQFELSVAEVRLLSEPEESHAAVRRALFLLLTPERVPVGTASNRISQLVQDEVRTVVAPFHRVRALRKDGVRYAEKELAKEDLSFQELRQRLKTIDEEINARVKSDWTPLRVTRLVDDLLDELLGMNDD